MVIIFNFEMVRPPHIDMPALGHFRFIMQFMNI